MGLSQERFRWLEFETAEPAAPRAAAEKDERYFLAEARKALLEGDYEPALRHFSAALKQNKQLHEAWAGQVRCLVRLREFREALTWAEKACNLFPDQPRLDSARATALACSGRPGEALAASDKALEQAEKTGLSDPFLWLDRALVLLSCNQPKTAKSCLAKLKESVGDDPDWAQTMAVEWLEAAQLTEALQLLNEVVLQRPQRPYVWLLLAQTYRRLGNRKKAEEALAKAEELRINWDKTSEERRLLRRACWIATLVYGHEEHPAVAALRRWRDGWAERAWGAAFCRLYDRTAPAVCRLLVCFGMRRCVRAMLDILVRKVEHGQKTRA